MSTFRARYPGRCVECDDDIEVGDLLRYDEDGHAVHASHTDGASPVWVRRKTDVICPACHLTLPCDCEVQL